MALYNVRASNGVLLPLASLEIYTHISSGIVQYEEVEYLGITYRKTYTWYSGSVTESAWTPL